MRKRSINSIYLLGAIAFLGLVLGLLLFAAGAIQRAEIQWRLREMDAAVMTIRTAPSGRVYSADEEPWIEFRRHRDRLVELGYLFSGEYDVDGTFYGDFRWKAPTGGGVWDCGGSTPYYEQHETLDYRWRVWDTADKQAWWEDRIAKHGRVATARRRAEEDKLVAEIFRREMEKREAARAESVEMETE